MTGTLRGVSNKHCLLSFFSLSLTFHLSMHFDGVPLIYIFSSPEPKAHR